MKNLTFIIFFLLCQINCFGQDLVGFVKDANGLPLSDIKVMNSTNGAETKTQIDGSFKVARVGFPVDLLFISDDYHIELLALSDLPSEPLEITLRKLSVALSEVLIRERRKVVFGLKQLRDVEDMAIYAGKKTEVVLLENAMGNLASNNPRQIYAQVVGLNIYEGSDAGLQLNIGGRGLDPNRTANFNTRQNGYDISADVLGYPESYYTPPAEALSEVQVIRGAASLQYGTQFGGLVNFKLLEPERDRKFSLLTKQTVGSFGLKTSFNQVSGTVGKLSYQSFFNYKKGNGFRLNADFQSENVFLQLAYQLTPKTKLSGEVTFFHYLAQQAGGLTDAQFYRDPLFSNRARNYFEVDWLLYEFKLAHQFTDNTRWSISFFGLDAARSAVGFRTNRVSQVDDEELARDLILGEFNNYGIESRFLSKYKLAGKEVIFLLGAKWYQSENSAIQGAGSNGSSADFSIANAAFPNYPSQSNFVFPNKNLALFTEHIYKITDKFTLTPGLRFEHINTASTGSFRRLDFDLAGNVIRDNVFRDDRDLKRSFTLLGIGAAYRPKKGLECYGNLSQNYRSVTFTDIRIVNPSFQVDAEIKDESGLTLDLGTRGSIRNIFRYDLGAYTILYNDRIGEVLGKQVELNEAGVEVETGRLVRTRGNIGDATIYGLEAFGEWNIHKFISEAESNYSLSVFTNLALTRSQYTQSEIVGIEGNEVEFIPVYNIKTGLRLGYKNLLTSLQLTTIGEQFTDASNAPQDVDDNQRGIEGSIPAYQIVDFSLSYKWKSFSLETGINNVLDQSYFTRRATGYPGPGIIPSDPRSYYLTLGYRL